MFTMRSLLLLLVSWSFSPTQAASTTNQLTCRPGASTCVNGETNVLAVTGLGVIPNVVGGFGAAATSDVCVPLNTCAPTNAFSALVGLTNLELFVEKCVLYSNLDCSGTTNSGIELLAAAGITSQRLSVVLASNIKAVRCSGDPCASNPAVVSGTGTLSNPDIVDVPVPIQSGSLPVVAGGPVIPAGSGSTNDGALPTPPNLPIASISGSLQPPVETPPIDPDIAAPAVVPAVNLPNGVPNSNPPPVVVVGGGYGLPFIVDGPFVPGPDNSPATPPNIPPGCPASPPACENPSETTVLSLTGNLIVPLLGTTTVDICVALNTCSPLRDIGTLGLVTNLLQFAEECVLFTDGDCQQPALTLDANAAIDLSDLNTVLALTVGALKCKGPIVDPCDPSPPTSSPPTSSPPTSPFCPTCPQKEIPALELAGELLLGGIGTVDVCVAVDTCQQIDDFALFSALSSIVNFVDNCVLFSNKHCTGSGITIAAGANLNLASFLGSAQAFLGLEGTFLQCSGNPTGPCTSNGGGPSSTPGGPSTRSSAPPSSSTPGDPSGSSSNPPSSTTPPSNTGSSDPPSTSTGPPVIVPSCYNGAGIDMATISYKSDLGNYEVIGMFNECTEIPPNYGQNIHGISLDVATSCILYSDRKCKERCQIGSPITESDSSIQLYRLARAIVCYGPNPSTCPPILPPVTDTGYMISTVYKTTVYTVTSCHPTMTKCHPGHVTTETVSLSTTICPVTEPTHIDWTTSTVYSTTIYTVTSCHHTATGCHPGHVTTETISLYTTVCPIDSDPTDTVSKSLSPFTDVDPLYTTSTPRNDGLPTDTPLNNKDPGSSSLPSAPHNVESSGGNLYAGWTFFIFISSLFLGALLII